MTSSTEPNRKRIRASAFDNSALILENAHTLIGRLTNPREQSITRVINDLPQIWTLQGSVLGSDLGNHCFQFRFQKAEDIQSVLSNRPYHSNCWMLIFQPWEPIISTSFPSQIPFWIKLKGLPLHFWHEEMMKDIAKELRTLEGTYITRTSVRLRILLNGLEPLAKDTIIEFSKGEEALVTFEYEELENICSTCNSLTHAARDCEVITLSTTVAPQASLVREETARFTNRPPNKSRTSPDFSKSGHRTHERRDMSYTPSFHQRVDRHGRPFGDRVSLSSHQAKPLKNKIIPSSYANPSSRRFSRNRGTDSLPESQYQWREKNQRQSPTNNDLTTANNLPAIEARSPLIQELPPLRPLGRNLEVCDFPLLPRIPTTEEVLSDLQEVTIQYINCPDPIESAARRQRVLQSDARGDMEQTAANIISAATEARAAMLPPTVIPSETTIILGDSHTSGPSVQTKRRGRPPTKKRQSPAPAKLAGTSFRKMNLAHISASPGRAAESSARASTTQSRQSSTSQTARTDKQPTPKSGKTPLDFHDLEPPLP